MVWNKPSAGTPLMVIAQEIKERDAETDSDELQRIIDDAVREVRDERRST